MADKRYQIFVSSTFRDLELERREVMQAILELDSFPAGMELFPAATEEAWKLIESVIEESDYYILIIGGRYGSTDEAGVSYTQREYELAKRIGKPILAFLHGDPGKICLEHSEMSAELREKLERFRSEIQRFHHCKYWTSAEELAGKVTRSLVQITKNHPAIGWVRASEARTAEDVTYLSEVEKELGEARVQISEYRRAIENLNRKVLAKDSEPRLVKEFDKLSVKFAMRLSTEEAEEDIEWSRVINLLSDTYDNLLDLLADLDEDKRQVIAENLRYTIERVATLRSDVRNGYTNQFRSRSQQIVSDLQKISRLIKNEIWEV